MSVSRADGTMLHPADRKENRYIGINCAFFGLLALALTIPDSDLEGWRPVGLIFGSFLLACSVAFFTVYAVGVLLRDHEQWRRNLDVPREES